MSLKSSSMKKLLSVISAVLGLASGASAQIREINRILSPGFNGQVFTVRDSLSGEGLCGAAVFLADGADTVKLVTDIDGVCRCRTQFSSDSITVLTSYLGYRGRKDRIRIDSKSCQYWAICLQTVPEQINEIIVRGNAVSMVMRGDTTRFNAAAFRAMEGDMLRDLLLKFPGVSLLGDEIRYNGQKVDRILFNGENMFGKDIGNAMDMVLSREVKSVSVYDRDDVTVSERDSTAARERVMDVRTWQPLKHVGQLRAGLGGGLYTSRNEDGKFDPCAGGQLSVGSYVSGTRPRLSLNVSGGLNSSVSDDRTVSTDSPRSSCTLKMRAGKDVERKYGWQHELTLSYGRDISRSGSTSSYSPSEDWKIRRDTSRVRSEQLRGQASYTGSGYWNWDSNRLTLLGTLSASLGRNARENASMSDADDRRTGFRLFERDTSRTVSFMTSAMYARTFSKRGRTLSASLNVSGRFSGGHGTRIDTAAWSMRRMWLTSASDLRDASPSLSFTWKEPLAGKSRILVMANSRYSYGLQRIPFLDRLTGLPDMNNSKDFLKNYVENTVSAGYCYGRMNDGLYFDCVLGLKDIADMGTERLGTAENWRRNWLRPVIRSRLLWSSGENSLSFSYRESESAPSASDLRSVVDDSNPMFLSAGNPSLSLPVSRMADFSYSRSFASCGLVLALTAGGSIHSDAIVSRTSYFQNDTYLPDYGYTAAAGSSLVVPENVSGRFAASAGLSADKYFSSAGVSLNGGIDWRMAGDPFFLNETLHRNLSDNLDFRLAVEYGGTSCSYRVAPQVGLGWIDCDGVRTSDWLSVGGRIEMKQRFWEFLELEASFVGEKVCSSRKETEYGNCSLDVSLSWLFGKDRRSNVSVYARDVLNDMSGLSNKVAANYILQSYRSLLGRSAGVSFVYVFSKR